MGLQDREYMHEKHRNQATTNRYLHPSLKSLKFKRSYKNLISATIYCLIAVLLVLSYLQAPTVTIANKKLKCTFETLKLDANGDGVFSIKDIGQLSLKGFSLPVKYVNSNSTLSPIVDFFEIKQQCDSSAAIALNGILWLLLYLGVLEAVRFLTNVSQLILKTLLFDLLKIKTSTSLLFSIYRAVHPRWDFAVNLRYPLLLLGGLTVISLLAIRPETPPTVSKNTNIPTTAAALDLAPTRPAAPKSVSNQSVSTASVAPIPNLYEKNAASLRAIDARVFSIDASAYPSPQALAAALTNGLTTELEKTYAIYRWITHNIAYDTEAFFSNKPISAASAASVLRTKRAVCDGYSELMMRLGRSVGLKIEKVSGYSKGYGYTQGQVDLIPNHAWNTVQIDGAWYLLDPTWDAGYVTYDTKSFLKKTDSYTFFLPDPNRFITSHYPEQQKWQLTSQPVSKQEFWAMPNLR